MFFFFVALLFEATVGAQESETDNTSPLMSATILQERMYTSKLIRKGELYVKGAYFADFLEIVPRQRGEVPSPYFEVEDGGWRSNSWSLSRTDDEFQLVNDRGSSIPVSGIGEEKEVQDLLLSNIFEAPQVKLWRKTRAIDLDEALIAAGIKKFPCALLVESRLRGQVVPLVARTGGKEQGGLSKKIELRTTTGWSDNNFPSIEFAMPKSASSIRVEVENTGEWVSEKTNLSMTMFGGPSLRKKILESPQAHPVKGDGAAFHFDVEGSPGMEDETVQKVSVVFNVDGFGVENPLKATKISVAYFVPYPEVLSWRVERTEYGLRSGDECKIRLKSPLSNIAFSLSLIHI